MQPLDPAEVAQRIAAERRHLKANSAQNKSLTERRRDAEYRKEMKESGQGEYGL